MNTKVVHSFVIPTRCGPYDVIKSSTKRFIAAQRHPSDPTRCGPHDVIKSSTKRFTADRTRGHLPMMRRRRAIVGACDMWPYAVSVLPLSCAVTLTVQLQHPSLPSGYDALLLGLSR